MKANTILRLSQYLPKPLLGRGWGGLLSQYLPKPLLGRGWGGLWRGLGVLGLCLISCERLTLPVDTSDGIDNSKQFVISGTTRAAASSEVTLPVSIYAIASSTVKDSTKIATLDGRWEIALGSGGWTITAMSGWPTWFGSQQIVVDDDAELGITLNPAIAYIDFALRGIENAKSVSVELAGLYKTMKPTGSYSGTKTETIALTKTDTAWIGSAYVYPTNGKLNLTIQTEDTTYYYAYTDGLDAAYKYHFRGSYEEGRAIMGWISVGDWAGEKTIDFNFGADQGAEILDLTMSTQTWSNVLSAYSDNPTQADSIASAYNEGGYTWRIPSREEAKSLREQHPDASATDRYLCEGGTYTYTFNPSGSITKAGSKTGYKLVLVR